MKRKSPTPWFPFFHGFFVLFLTRCISLEASDWLWTARDHGKGIVSAVVSFPPSFARTFSSRERRLGTRQSLYKDMLPLKIYPYLSDPRNKRNRRKICRNVQFTESMGQLWLAINLYSIYNSNDQRRFFNTMECDYRRLSLETRGEVRRKKDNFELFHIFG